MKKGLVVILAAALMLTAGCSIKEVDKEKIKDIEFTVLNEEKIPQELLDEIGVRKNAPFKLTYSDGQYLYIAAGYGEQVSGGYSIQVNELYLTENAIYFDASLIGPDKNETISESPSYPFIVVKIEHMDKNVVFE